MLDQLAAAALKTRISGAGFPFKLAGTSSYIDFPRSDSSIAGTAETSQPTNMSFLGNLSLYPMVDSRA